LYLLLIVKEISYSRSTDLERHATRRPEKAAPRQPVRRWRARCSRAYCAVGSGSGLGWNAPARQDTSTSYVWSPGWLRSGEFAGASGQDPPRGSLRYEGLFAKM